MADLRNVIVIEHQPYPWTVKKYGRGGKVVDERHLRTKAAAKSVAEELSDGGELPIKQNI